MSARRRQATPCPHWNRRGRVGGSGPFAANASPARPFPHRNRRDKAGALLRPFAANAARDIVHLKLVELAAVAAELNRVQFENRGYACRQSANAAATGSSDPTSTVRCNRGKTPGTPVQHALALGTRGAEFRHFLASDCGTTWDDTKSARGFAPLTSIRYD